MVSLAGSRIAKLQDPAPQQFQYSRYHPSELLPPLQPLNPPQEPAIRPKFPDRTIACCVARGRADRSFAPVPPHRVRACAELGRVLPRWSFPCCSRSCCSCSSREWTFRGCFTLASSFPTALEMGRST